MKMLYGKPVAEGILADIACNIRDFDRAPHLAVILIGNDPASHLYVSLKEKEARKVGIEVSVYKFAPLESEQSVLDAISLLNTDDDVDGIIVQLPLPSGFDTQKIINSLDPKKDVDGFHPLNITAFVDGGTAIVPVFPRAISLLIASSGETLAEKKAVIVANSNEFGRIMSAMLKSENIASRYILATDISSHLEQIKAADIVVSAVGSPGLLSGGMFKEGAIVIDGGIEKAEDKVMGDVDFASTEENNGYITPVPGGVGPVTIACLLENVYRAFLAQQKEKSS